MKTISHYLIPVCSVTVLLSIYFTGEHREQKTLAIDSVEWLTNRSEAESIKAVDYKISQREKNRGDKVESTHLMQNDSMTPFPHLKPLPILSTTQCANH